MQHKLFSNTFDKTLDKLLLQNSERVIRRLIRNQLQEKEIALIIDNYQKQLFTEPTFSSQNFLLDLSSYLKYLELSDFQPHLYSSFFKKRFNTLKQAILKSTCKQAVSCSVDQHQQNAVNNKKVCLDQNTNKVVRSYYSNPADFFLSKLLRVSEADISKIIDNNLLIVSVANVPGEPIDIAERALPLAGVFKKLSKTGHQNIINQIKSIQKTNILVTDYADSVNANAGLVVRSDRQGNKKVYVVALDLSLKTDDLFKEIDYKRQEILRIKQQCLNTSPQSLDYEYLVKFVVRLQDLTPQFSPLIGNF